MIFRPRGPVLLEKTLKVFDKALVDLETAELDIAATQFENDAKVDAAWAEYVQVSEQVEFDNSLLETLRQRARTVRSNIAALVGAE